MNFGTVANCYNRANVVSNGVTSRTYNEIYAGGVVGGNYKYLENCYNTGRITGSGYGAYIGGVVGAAEVSQGGYFKNCYNIGQISGSGSTPRLGGVIRKNWI